MIDGETSTGIFALGYSATAAAQILPWIGLGATLAGWWANSFLAAKRDRANERRRARAEYRATILTCFEGLYPLGFSITSDHRDRVIRTAFPKLQLAVELFRPHLTASEASDLDGAWRTFRLFGHESRNDVLITQGFMNYIGQDGHANFKAAVDGLLQVGRSTRHEI